jgi:hypothetical protein
MYKSLLFLLGFSLLISCKNAAEKYPKGTNTLSNNADSIAVTQTLNHFHAAAARSDFEGYFNFFTEDAIFIGTDATERWDKAGFQAYARAPFAAGRGWNYVAVDRHIYLSANQEQAWFDELLDAPYAKIARGSGVLVKTTAGWKIQQYVLSMTIPNALSDSVVQFKSAIEQALLDSLERHSNQTTPQ